MMVLVVNGMGTLEFQACLMRFSSEPVCRALARQLYGRWGRQCTSGCFRTLGFFVFLL